MLKSRRYFFMQCWCSEYRTLAIGKTEESLNSLFTFERKHQKNFPRSNGKVLPSSALLKGRGGFVGHYLDCRWLCITRLRAITGSRQTCTHPTQTGVGTRVSLGISACWSVWYKSVVGRFVRKKAWRWSSVYSIPGSMIKTWNRFSPLLCKFWHYNGYLPWIKYMFPRNLRPCLPRFSLAKSQLF